MGTASMPAFIKSALGAGVVWRFIKVQTAWRLVPTREQRSRDRRRRGDGSREEDVERAEGAFTLRVDRGRDRATCAAGEASPASDAAVERSDARRIETPRGSEDR